MASPGGRDGSRMLFGKKKRRIGSLLIVEDEPLIAFDTEHYLGDEGYRIVATVDRVAHALEHVRGASEIDMVLLDVDLSDGSGIDVAREAHARGIAVLFVTGSCPADAVEFGRGCLTKPYSQRDMLASIEAIGAVLGGEAPRRVPAGLSLFHLTV